MIENENGIAISTTTLPSLLSSSFLSKSKSRKSQYPISHQLTSNEINLFTNNNKNLNINNKQTQQQILNSKSKFFFNNNRSINNNNNNDNNNNNNETRIISTSITNHVVNGYNGENENKSGSNWW